MNSYSLMRGTASGVALMLLLGGCATFSKDGGFDSVAQLSEARLGQTVKPVRNSDDAKAVDASSKICWQNR